jgi:signal transduction histidine kinase
MSIRGAGHRATAELAPALLEIARLIAREAPDEIVFATVSERLARHLGVESASVLRYLGDERAVVVGVWRERGGRALPVNAELDFDRRNSAIGRVRSTRRPARADSYEGKGGELPLVMRSIDLRSSVAAPVMLGNEVWGAVVASTSSDEPLPADCEHQIADFAELAAQAVCNAEARDRAAASHLRIVEAGDESRRRLERDLHEGAQQHLLALTLRLRVARGRAEDGTELAALLDGALEDAELANTELRELARGLFPVVLTQRGLSAALQALIARAPIPVHMLELPGRRFPAPAEATAYFVVVDTLELARPRATDATVIVGDRGDRLVVEVRADAGPPAGARPPALADRVAAVGGRLQIDSPPEGGVVVRAELPVV